MIYLLKQANTIPNFTN